MIELVSRERVLELLDYDPGTGIFTWKVRRTPLTKIGSCAGSLDKDGYRCISVDERTYKAHRLAWLVVYSIWPRDQIDHINGVKDDNRIDNLREATNAENKRNSERYTNSTSGYKGVSYHKDRKKFQAYCQSSCGIQRYLGLFSTDVEAARAYDDFARVEHGEFARLNFPRDGERGLDGKIFKEEFK